MIAILGATGYVGGSLARLLAERGEPLSLFCRDPAKLDARSWPADVTIARLDDFSAAPFGVVVNAIGAGDPARVAALGGDILDITRIWDERVLSTMVAGTRYVFLSSGAVYGTFVEPAAADSELRLPVNRLETVSPYTIAKLRAELRHRHMPDRHILDLRVFGYADKAISLSGRFFLSELARSVAEGAPFVTSANDMIRDYGGAAELAAMIDSWLAAGGPNRALDLYSRAPVAKSALLAAARTRYGLEVVVAGEVATSATGPKPIYASNFKAAAEFGYEPQRSSAEIVVELLDSVRKAVR